MTRPLSDAMARAMKEGAPRALFAQIDHPSGTGYFFSGVGSRSWNGQTWKGTGTLGTVAPIQKSTDISVQDVTFTLSGVDADNLATLTEDVRNRLASVWLACFDKYDNVVVDPYKLVDAELDYQTLDISDDATATISITAHSGMYVLDRAVDEAWTPENQKLKHPDDAGLDMIPTLVNQDLRWTPT